MSDINASCSVLVIGNSTLQATCSRGGGEGGEGSTPLYELHMRWYVQPQRIALGATFLFLPYFDVICDLLVNRRMATWNVFVK